MKWTRRLRTDFTHRAFCSPWIEGILDVDFEKDVIGVLRPQHERRLGIVASESFFFGPVVRPEASLIENAGAVVAGLAAVAGLVAVAGLLVSAANFQFRRGRGGRGRVALLAGGRRRGRRRRLHHLLDEHHRQPLFFSLYLSFRTDFQGKIWIKSLDGIMRKVQEQIFRK